MTINLEFGSFDPSKASAGIRRIAVRCDNCGKTLTDRPGGSACECLMARMQCKCCHRLVYRSGNDSDGVGIYNHDPCGMVSEYQCRDIRLLPVQFDMTRVDPFCTEAHVSNLQVRRARCWYKPWTWLRPYTWYILAECVTGRPAKKNDTTSRTFETCVAHCPDCDIKTQHIVHKMTRNTGEEICGTPVIEKWNLYECRECGEMHENDDAVEKSSKWLRRLFGA